MELQIAGKESDKEKRECDLTSLTDGELEFRIKRILRLKGLMSYRFPDMVHRLCHYLQKNLDEKERRRDLATVGVFGKVKAGLHLKCGCPEECKDEVMELHNLGIEGDKEQRECDRDYDLTSLTDGELDNKIERIQRVLRITGLISYRLPDGGHKLRLFLGKHLDEKKRRKDLAKVSIILEIPKDRFLMLLEEGLTTVYKEEVKRAHFLPQERNNLNEKEMDVLKDYMKTHNMRKPEKKRKAEPKI